MDVDGNRSNISSFVLENSSFVVENSTFVVENSTVELEQDLQDNIMPELNTL